MWDKRWTKPALPPFAGSANDVAVLLNKHGFPLGLDLAQAPLSLSKTLRIEWVIGTNVTFILRPRLTEQTVNPGVSRPVSCLTKRKNTMNKSQIYQGLMAAALATAALAFAAPAHAAVDAAAAEALARQNNCFKCHGLTKKKDGPSFQESAAKFKGKPDAEARLVHHLTSGEKAKFPDDHEEDHKIIKAKDEAEIKNLANWILSQ